MPTATEVSSAADGSGVLAKAMPVVQPVSYTESAPDTWHLIPGTLFSIHNPAFNIQTSPLTITYTYDPLGRLTAADYDDSTYFHYTYDAVGNRLTQNTLAGTNTYTYGIANRLTNVDGVAYTWDASGNFTNYGVNTYTYDAANRLIEVSNQYSVSSYQYSGLGDRLQQTVNGVPTNYTLDLNPSTSFRAGTGLTQVLSDGTYTYLYGNGRISQSTSHPAPSTSYFLTDALGSVRQLVDPTGSLRWSPSQRIGDPRLSTHSTLWLERDTRSLRGIQHLISSPRRSSIGCLFSTTHPLRK